MTGHVYRYVLIYPENKFKLDALFHNHLMIRYNIPIYIRYIYRKYLAFLIQSEYSDRISLEIKANFVSYIPRVLVKTREIKKKQQILHLQSFHLLRGRFVFQ